MRSLLHLKGHICPYFFFLVVKSLDVFEELPFHQFKLGRQKLKLLLIKLTVFLRLSHFCDKHANFVVRKHILQELFDVRNDRVVTFDCNQACLIVSLKLWILILDFSKKLLVLKYELFVVADEIL